MPSVTRTSSEGRSARRKRIVALLLDTVEQALAEGESYTELSVERLITAAKMSRSTFYVYFEDKGVLLLALAEDVVAQLVTAAEGWWNLPPDLEKDQLGSALQDIISTYRQHEALWGAIVDAASYDPNVNASVQRIVGATSKGLEKHIRATQKAGYARDDVDPARTAAWLTWMTERGLYQLLPGASEAEVAKLRAAQATIVWNTLYEGASKRS